MTHPREEAGLRPIREIIEEAWPGLIGSVAEMIEEHEKGDNAETDASEAA